MGLDLGVASPSEGAASWGHSASSHPGVGAGKRGAGGGPGLGVPGWGPGWGAARRARVVGAL